jgi:hypothetical protein
LIPYPHLSLYKIKGVCLEPFKLRFWTCPTRKFGGARQAPTATVFGITLFHYVLVLSMLSSYQRSLHKTTFTSLIEAVKRESAQHALVRYVKRSGFQGATAESSTISASSRTIYKAAYIRNVASRLGLSRLMAVIAVRDVRMTAAQTYSKPLAQALSSPLPVAINSRSLTHGTGRHRCGARSPTRSYGFSVPQLCCLGLGAYGSRSWESLPCASCTCICQTISEIDRAVPCPNVELTFACCARTV